MKLLHGECLEQMRLLESNSVDAIVTDPPYGLAFMGKKWDYDVPSKEIWIEALRVLKPGGHLLSFGGTRTYHRMVVNIEDAGFEIRDQIQWLYGSGFPKSQNIALTIDKKAGVTGHRAKALNYAGKGERNDIETYDPEKGMQAAARYETKTDLAKQWDGWGTALKPANEPICLARKPLEGTVAQNIEKWGVGGINIDGCRIDYLNSTDKLKAGTHGRTESAGKRTQQYGQLRNGIETEPENNRQGRWPANLLLDETAAEMLDEQSGVSRSNIRNPNGKNLYAGNALLKSKTLDSTIRGVSDAGGASRFFYVAKASKSERNAGLEGMPEKNAPKFDGGDFMRGDNNNAKDQKSQNFHPTVKPLKLMEYLCKLIAPPSGTILDPFMGSGTTGIAAKNLEFNFVGIEMNEEYFEIAKRRVG